MSVQGSFYARNARTVPLLTHEIAEWVPVSQQKQAQEARNRDEGLWAH